MKSPALQAPLQSYSLYKSWVKYCIFLYRESSLAPSCVPPYCSHQLPSVLWGCVCWVAAKDLVTGVWWEYRWQCNWLVFSLLLLVNSMKATRETVFWKTETEEIKAATALGFLTFLKGEGRESLHCSLLMQIYKLSNTFSVLKVWVRLFKKTFWVLQNTLMKLFHLKQEFNIMYLKRWTKSRQSRQRQSIHFSVQIKILKTVIIYLTQIK